VVLGLLHGLNPSMGWLFAVARGLQERSAGAVLHALLFIAVGHGAAVVLGAAVAVALGQTLPRTLFLVLSGAALIVFSAGRLLWRSRHPRTRFRASAWELVWWSFLMATAHGAGLMVAPFVAVLPTPGHPAPHLHAAATGGAQVVLLATLVHTAAQLVAMAAAAVAVHRLLGLAVLNRVWFNADLVWPAALVATGLLALAAAVATARL
jgi:hypothetical protein